MPSLPARPHTWLKSAPCFIQLKASKAALSSVDLNASSKALARTDIGANIDIAYTAGSTVTGQSAAEVGGSSAAGTANYRIVGVSKDSENNELGAVNVNMIVMINEHAYKIEAGI